MKKYFGEKRLLKLLKHSVSACGYSYRTSDLKSYKYFLWDGVYSERISFVSDVLEFDLCCFHEIENYFLIFYVYKRGDDNRLKIIDGFSNYYSFSFLPELSKGVEVFGLFSSGSEFEGIEFFNFNFIEHYFLFDLGK